ncbi:MAG TPA: hypothetical protein DCO83_13450 [Mucilaginibacter sp.]|jgi:ABC-type lipoprotein export system ATPase subunit|nr:hypothetical protein [Mucilaginibacter sp.]
MFIKVIEWRYNNLSGLGNDATFFLEKDNWNDHSYLTTYALHLSGAYTPDKQPVTIGRVKILKLEQKEDEYNLKTGDEITTLGPEYCSLGQSLDYYQRIAKLKEPLRTEILTALRDIVIYPENKVDFEEEPGFGTSLMRSISESDDLFELGPLMVERNFYELPSIDLKFEFTTPGLNEPFHFDFDSNKYGFNEDSLPNRIIALIGRNGSGKSTLLSRISRIAFASTTDRENAVVKQIGEIKPEGIGFPRIIVLSYSAFDTFQVPGIYKVEKETIAKEMKEGLSRYVFCGIRDIIKELEDSIDKLKIDDFGRLMPEDILQDRTENTYLKSIRDLANEFCKNVRIIEELNETAMLDRVMGILSDEESLHYLADTEFFEADDAQNMAFFMRLSTGHKFVFHAITCIVAFTGPRSLLLFDEPETHLHPPILAVLMKAVRKVLKDRKSFMVIATHSPVVLQETLKRHVYVVRRQGELITWNHPDIQTFGENTGLLTSTAFGLSSEVSDYHHTLDKVINALTDKIMPVLTPEQLLKEIENTFDGELSMQATAYILSKINNRQ